MSTIEIRRLTRRFGRTTAVDAVDLSIDDGEFLVLLGPSGCGKTTLLRMLAGLIEPTEGEIVIDGRDVTTVPPARRDVAMVFQSYALYPHLSVAKNLGFPLRVRRTPRADGDRRVREVAGLLEIDHLLQRRPKELSGGQRQRVAVGRALVRSPRAFLMDEPLSNLDAKLRTATRQELTALHRRLGATFVYVTHDQVEAMTMATRIAVMNSGRVEQVGTPAEVYDRPESSFVAGFLGSPAMNLVDARVVTAGGAVCVEVDGGAGVLWTGRTEPLEIVLGVRPEHLTITDTPPDIGLSLHGVVLLTENLGSEELLTVQVGAHHVSLRRPRGELQPTTGAAVRLWARAENLHLFDRGTGRRLEWVDTSQGDLTTPVLTGA